MKASKNYLPEYYLKYCVPLYLANPEEAYNKDDVFHKDLPPQKIILLAKSIHNDLSLLLKYTRQYIRQYKPIPSNEKAVGIANPGINFAI